MLKTNYEFIKELEKRIKKLEKRIKKLEQSKGAWTRIGFLGKGRHPYGVLKGEKWTIEK